MLLPLTDLQSGSPKTMDCSAGSNKLCFWLRPYSSLPLCRFPPQHPGSHFLASSGRLCLSHVGGELQRSWKTGLGILLRSTVDGILICLASRILGMAAPQWQLALLMDGISDTSDLRNTLAIPTRLPIGFHCLLSQSMV